MIPVGATPFGRAVAAVTTHPLGVGPGRFHFQGDVREEVDTVYLGCFWAETLRDVGGYDDEGIQWGAEDHELNLRIAATGGSIVLDPQIRSTYFPRESPRGLARQYHNYGLGKASTLRKHGRLPTWRPLAPAGLVLTSGVLAILGRGYFQRTVIPMAHAGVIGVSALALSRDAGVAPHRAFAAMWIAHWSYGVGFLRGLGRAALGRLPDRKRS
jgi:hypothetical protein